MYSIRRLFCSTVNAGGACRMTPEPEEAEGREGRSEDEA